jgi:hypothetical protein
MSVAVKMWTEMVTTVVATSITHLVGSNVVILSSGSVGYNK